ncbi:putative leucine-rich repeat-containing protein DDB_G0290503 isoform X4 [Hydra vulgaris]|uniref:Leucine-rich repeat-containing protein DDB_G0290503 isoform X4 n=1 Tax=Hydra vulgaris TaxID=6087 RepID=A0ABM4DJQ7_HYDVU
MADNVTNKKSKVTKTKTYNKKLKKYSWRHSHRHIGSYLLPSVALVIAIPSAKKINLSLSHSSIVIALGFISKIAQLFVGDLIHGVEYPPILSTCTVSDDSDSINVSQSDSLYAKVSKKRKFRPNDTNCIENISTASEIKGSSHSYNSNEFKHSISKLNQYSEMLNETLRKVNCNLFNGCNCGAFNNAQLIEFHENMNHFKKQNEILCSENEALRNIVLRLNQEVANLKKDKESVEDKHISNEYISGLLSSYDLQLKEKDDIIVSLKEIKDKMIPEDKWNALKEQAKIVLEEYEDSMKQIHLYKETICKLTNEHSLKMIELENQLTEQSKGKKYAEQELLELKDGYLLLKSQIENFEKSQGSIVSLNDHLKIVENLSKEHNNEVNQLITKMDDMSFKLAALTKERDTLAVQTSELYAENLCLSSQVKTMEKHTRAQKKQINHQMKEIESLKKMDLTTKETLSQVIKVAEYVKQERDNLTDIMNQKKSEEVLASHQESVELKRLQHNLKISKLKAKKKLNQLNQRLQEQNEEFDKLRKTYENELNDLKDIVRQKQNHIERLNFNKSSYDERFNELWSSFHENDKV